MTDGAPSTERVADIPSLARRLDALADGIAQHVHSVLLRHGELPARSFYGEAFSALLLSRERTRYAGSLTRLAELYDRKDHSDPGFHWEFNKYAWWTIYRETGDETAKRFALPLRFRNTQVTNWALLRACTRFLAGMEVDLASSEASAVLRRFQLRSGLICDQPHVRSFQYHCFSGVLVAETAALSDDAFFLERFRRAAAFIERFVLRTGDALYIGRGQEQSFGYGALACLLATAFSRFGESKYVAALARCVSLLEAHRRPDGSFPLVLNDIEVGYPATACASDARFPGWYAYNNYFDYLPFLGVFLRKAADALQGTASTRPNSNSADSCYRDGSFLVFRNERYEAVLSRPGGGWRGREGYWTNDLPFPYVVWGRQRVTPSYGGEQFGSSLYSAAGIPLPVIERRGTRTPLREGRIWSRFVGNSLVVLSPLGGLLRRFSFLEDGVVIEDSHLFVRRSFARYLFDGVRRLDDRTFSIRGGTVVTFSVPMQLEDSGDYYWGGPLQALVARAPTSRCTVHLLLEHAHERS